MASTRDDKVLIPELWSESIVRAFRERQWIPRVMISDKALQELIDASSGTPQLDDICRALEELRWRRSQQVKVEDQLRKVNVYIDAHLRPQYPPRLSSMIDRLKSLLSMT